MKNQLRHLPAMVAALLGMVAVSQAAAQGDHAGHRHQEHSEHVAPPSNGGHAPERSSEIDQRGLHIDAPAPEEGAHDQHGERRPPSSSPRTPIPPVTDDDRSAVFLDERGHTVHDNAVVTFLLLDQFEWQDAEEGSALSWDATGWVGNDIDRLWFRSEGERSDGETEEAELQLLWGHAIGPWWDVVAGIRHDFKPRASQTWGAVGIQGLALYDFETEATLYVGEGGQAAARLSGEYDILLTNRLILQPTAEINFYGKDDLSRAVGAGLADAEIGLRLRYEIRREFAPYIGVSWTRLYGNTADFAQNEGAAVEDTRLVIGFRAWY